MTLFSFVLFEKEYCSSRTKSYYFTFHELAHASVVNPVKATHLTALAGRAKEQLWLTPEIICF